jgi:hypothetical protein
LLQVSSVSCVAKAGVSLLQVLDKNTVKLVGQEYGLLVVDKEKGEVADAAKKKNEFMDEDDFELAVSWIVCGIGTMHACSVRILSGL